jgi:hypothetical protein
MTLLELIEQLERAYDLNPNFGVYVSDSEWGPSPLEKVEYETGKDEDIIVLSY